MKQIISRGILIVLVFSMFCGIVQAGGYLSEYDSDLKFLAHFNGTAGNTTTIDSSPSSFAIAFNDGGANNQINTTQKQFGVSSYYLNDEAIGRGLTVSGGTAFTPSTGNYTKLFWYKHTPDRNPSTIFYGDPDFNIYYNGANILYFTAGAQQITLPNDTSWHQIVEQRTGTGSNQYKVYVDGVANITATDSSDIGAISSWVIGNTYNAANDESFIDEYAIWTTDIPISKLWPQPYEVDQSVDPMAAFSQNKTSGASPLAVLCTDTSINSPNIWVWAVNGTEIQNSSSIRNFEYTFVPAGQHQISLTVWNTTLATTPSTVSHNVTVNSTIIADFAAAPTSGFATLDVSFVDMSSPADIYSWVWSFGDGGTSTSRNPTHSYLLPGNYTVNLTVTNPDGSNVTSKADYISVSVSEDVNPFSTLKFKPDANIINNQTRYNRTIQLTNVTSASFLSGTTLFPASYIFVTNVRANTSTYADNTLVSSSIDNINGTISFNVSRPSEFSPGGTPASLVDVEMFQKTYTTGNTTSGWGSGLLGNSTYNTTHPVTYYADSPLTYGSWITYSDFSINNTHPVIFNDAVTFTPIGPVASANRWLWNFGDGTTFLDANGTSVTHMYSASSSNTTLSASLTAYLVENTSVTNTTTHAISPILPISYVEASFSGSPTSGSVGVNVMFTDTSKFGASNAESGRTYNWSFGDDGYSANPYSSVVGDVSHVYSNLGTYTVTLTVNNTYNSSSYSIVNFITVSNQQNYAVTYPPKDVRFHIQTLYGQALQGVFAEATPRQTSTGSYAYTASLFGYQLGVVPLNNLTLSGYTDSKGDITMAMMADVQYELGFTGTGYTFDNQTITPHDDNYIIMPRGTGGSPFVTNGSSPQTDVLFTATYTRYNETAALLHINYTDYSLLTTGGDITLYRPNTSLGYTYNNVSEQETFVSVHFTGPNTTKGYILIDGATPACPASSSAIFTDTYTLVACTNQTLVNDKSYFAAATGMTPGGNVSVQAPVWFKNIHTPIAGLSAEFALFAALGIMMFTAMMATQTTAPAISIVFTFEGWVFYGMNMFMLIDSPSQFGISVVTEVLVLITGISIGYNFVEYRRKGK